MTDPSTYPRIAVLVPTYRRPHLLRRTLESLRLQQYATSFRIIVADNDSAKHEGAELARQWAFEHGFEDRVDIIIVPEKGLSQVRNSGLSMAFSDPDTAAVAMIDDDAEADADWLSKIGHALRISNAAIIGGPTCYKLDEDVPDWIAQADMFQVPFLASGAVPRLRSTNNCTLTRRLFERMGPQLFDPAFSSSGGEDVHLFRRCQQNGLVAYWAKDAIVSEIVPSERSTEEWVLTRHRSSAANIARIELSLRGRAVVVSMQLASAAREMLAGLVRLISADTATRFVGRLRIAGAVGRIHGLMGRTPTHKTHSI